MTEHLAEKREMHFTPQLRDDLRKQYDKAVKDGKDKFVFNTWEILTGYAKYLLEYLDTRFEELDSLRRK